MSRFGGLIPHVKTGIFVFLGLFTVLILSFFPRLSLAQTQSIGSDITSLGIVTTAEPPKTINQALGDSEFAGNFYTLNFLGLTQSIKELSYAGGRASVDAAIPTKVEIQRKPRRDQRQVAWYAGTLNPNQRLFTFLSSGPLSEEQLLSGNNILAGYDNVFTNTGANVQNRPYNGNTSIERLDFILDSPIQASDSRGFVVLERGPVTAHDGFKIAAITGINRPNKVIAYGPILNVEVNSWGKVPLVTPIIQTYVVNNSADGGRDVPQNPALTVPTGQTLGGVVIPTNAIANPGQTIYGYSIFAPDVTCSSAELVNVNNPCFPANTAGSGGIDLPAANLGAVLLQPGT